ncbi:hypothetical protein [Mucilaginibacter lacusdianchii]|uniref:hypothetical protein n=1 Tax=Mucilaginibacter lacusdianchii TaxID=2684211 RepID=UPI00131D5705|nr:hypothetical protein [Mucilaginibacter sp. JXJ CY 39]
MSKKTFLGIALVSLIVSACNDNKKQEQDLMSQVIKLHDEVMAKDEAAVKNKMVLDSLVKTIKPGASRDSATTCISKLNVADKTMEFWMHQFTADNTGKSHDEIMKYLADQKKKLMEVDNQITAAVNQSNTYIAIYKK